MARRQANRAAAVQDFLIGLFDAADPNKTQGREVTVRELLDLGASDLQKKLAAQPQLQEILDGVLVELYGKLGDENKALPLAEARRDLALRAEGADSLEYGDALYALARVEGELGHNELAEKTFREAAAQMAPIGAAVYALAAVASVMTGWLSDRWLARGASGNRVRKTALMVGCGGVTLCLSLCVYSGPVGSLLALAGCGVFLGIKAAAFYNSVQSLAGPAATARWMGVQNTCSNIAGVTAPLMTGVLVDRTGSFTAAFVIAAALGIVGIVAFGFVVRCIEPIDWNVTAHAVERRCVLSDLVTPSRPQGTISSKSNAITL